MVSLPNHGVSSLSIVDVQRESIVGEFPRTTKSVEARGFNFSAVLVAQLPRYGGWKPTRTDAVCKPCDYEVLHHVHRNISGAAGATSFPLTTWRGREWLGQRRQVHGSLSYFSLGCIFLKYTFYKHLTRLGQQKRTYRHSVCDQSCSCSQQTLHIPGIWCHC